MAMGPRDGTSSAQGAVLLHKPWAGAKWALWVVWAEGGPAQPEL